LLCLAALAVGGCPPAGEGPPTASEAESFLAEAEQTLLEKENDEARHGWVQATFITSDTDTLYAEANERYIAAAVDLGKRSTRYSGLELAEDQQRKLNLLRLALPLPAPDDAELRGELTRIAAGMESAYGRGEYCTEEGDCRDLGDLSRVMATSRDPRQLEEVWVGWRTIAPPLRPEYERFAELGNQGARELGFDDLGAMWRSKYDLPPDEFTAETERLWQQVRPLYEQLHCYVRGRLGERYGEETVPPGEPIPAHLLGNMWAQSWGNIYDLVAAPGDAVGVDLTALLEEAGVDSREMVRYGERFFTSLGFEPLPDTFWERSQFDQPQDHDAVCHASAWNIDYEDDIRIKMCIQTTGEDFNVVHHELGHNIYQRAYNQQPLLFRNGANGGFHEAVGDAVALSVTPDYLVQIGLLDEAPSAEGDLGLLLQQALDKVAFLPFGLLVDKWRWNVFSGETPPAEYNADWWELRQRYQGITPPVARSEEDFDPGAKYHVPANTSYTRYFLAHILQYQFHRALCAAAEQQGPLHRCSIYGNEAAGERLQEMLAMGASRPWPDALEAITGTREMDATAILDYFAPLATWLEEQNSGRQCGW
jgi:peptidyl-dipeptidase A